MKLALLFSLLILVCLIGVPRAEVILSEREIAKVLRHGPWPPAVTPDPSNKVSGNPAAIRLGQQLFGDTRLSRDNSLSCVSCHDPLNDFADSIARANGRTKLDRNTQSLWNASIHRWFGWSGDTDSLWSQNLTPLLNPDEMDHDPTSLQRAIKSSPYVEKYEQVFGPISAEKPISTGVNVAKALAAYIETLITDETSFDRFRDALERQDFEAAAQYPEAAQRGLRLFVGKGQCSSCHSGPAFTNGEFHDAGVPYFLEMGRVDPGRHAGLRVLKGSPFTLDGEYSDDPAKTGAWAVRNVRFSHADFGTFRVPSLRGVSRTAPYMHDGSLPDLHSVLSHYNEIDIERLHADGEAILRPLGLDDAALSDLQAFLESISDDHTEHSNLPTAEPLKQ